MSKEQRVVITGIGALSPIGNDAKTSWKNALNGVSGIDKITRIDTEPYNVHLAGELKDFNIEDYIDKKKQDEWIFYANMQSWLQDSSCRCELKSTKVQLINLYGLACRYRRYKTFENAHNTF